jgi:hypothetical protein
MYLFTNFAIIMYTVTGWETSTDIANYCRPNSTETIYKRKRLKKAQLSQTQ